MQKKSNIPYTENSYKEITIIFSLYFPRLSDQAIKHCGSHLVHYDS